MIITSEITHLSRDEAVRLNKAAAESEHIAALREQITDVQSQLAALLQGQGDAIDHLGRSEAAR